MKVLQLCFDGSAVKSVINAWKKGIFARIVKTGTGYRKCTGDYTYSWVKTSRPDFLTYMKWMSEGKRVELCFESKEARSEFLKQMEDLLPKESIVAYEFEHEIYYGMPGLYGIEISYTKK